MTSFALLWQKTGFFSKRLALAFSTVFASKAASSGLLGAGSAASLGLDGNDLGKALTVMTELTRAANQEKQQFDPSILEPQLNRAQRRKAKRRKHHV